MKFSAIIALTVAVALAGCQNTSETTPKRVQGVVLIVLDTLRADHLGCYGYERPTSPTLDRLAADGVRFDQAISCSPWTLPSVSAILAGEYFERVFDQKLTSSLVARLQEVGIETAAFTEGAYFSQAFGHDLGFDEFTEEEGAVQFIEPGEGHDPAAAGGIARTFDRAATWLEAHRDDRFFLLVHTYEPHTPYTNADFVQGLDPGRVGPTFDLSEVAAVLDGRIEPTPAEREYVTALYDGDILNSDRHVAELLAKLDELGLSDTTAIVVTSDHGEELDDHYPRHFGGHGHSLRDPLLRVPLIVHDPTRTFAQSTVAEQVRTIDVMPTVLELMEVIQEDRTEGRSLIPLMNGETESERVAAAGQTSRGPMRVAVRGMGYKFIQSVPTNSERSPMFPTPPEQQLYDLGRDPGEYDNLSHKAQLLVTLAALLKQHHPSLGASVEHTVPNDPVLLERLKSLGYID